MLFTVDVRPTADAQVAAADRWWRENRPSSPDLFAEELTSAFGTLERTPDVGKTYRRRGIPHLRRLLMLRTQHRIRYVHAPDQQVVLVLAVWSALRRRGPPLKPGTGR